MTLRAGVVAAAVLLVAVIVIAGAAVLLEDEAQTRADVVADRGVTGAAAVPPAAELARIAVPPGATGVDADFVSALDAFARLRFTTTRAQARSAVRRAGLRLVRRSRPTSAQASDFARLGWKAPSPAGTRGVRRDEPGLSREVLVVPRPDGRATVYAVAFTGP